MMLCCECCVWTRVTYTDMYIGRKHRVSWRNIKRGPRRAKRGGSREFWRDFSGFVRRKYSHNPARQRLTWADAITGLFARNASRTC